MCGLRVLNTAAQKALPSVTGSGGWSTGDTASEMKLGGGGITAIPLQAVMSIIQTNPLQK